MTSHDFVRSTGRTQCRASNYSIRNNGCLSDGGNFRLSVEERGVDHTAEKCRPSALWRGGRDAHEPLRLGDGWAGRPQDDATVADFHPGLRVSRDGEGQTFKEMLAEAAHCAEPGAKLGVKGRPTDFNVLFQSVETICQPDIHVDYHGSWPDRAKGGFTDRDWMFA